MLNVVFVLNKGACVAMLIRWYIILNGEQWWSNVTDHCPV